MASTTRARRPMRVPLPSVRRLPLLDADEALPFTDALQNVLTSSTDETDKAAVPGPPGCDPPLCTCAPRDAKPVDRRLRRC